MKTKKFRLLVTMFTLAAVITIGTAPATAQRRTTGVNNTETREQKSNNQQNSSVQNRNNSNNAKISTPENKSANVQNRQATPAQRNTNVRTETTSRAASTQSNTNAQRRESTSQQENRNQTSTNKSANVQNRQTTPAQRNTNVRTETTNRTGSTQGNTNTQRRETTNPQVNREQPNTNTNRNTTVNTNTERNRNVDTNRNNASTANRPENNATRRSSSTSVSSGGEYSRNVNNPEARRTTENARRIYRLDENDSRYKPNNDFKGGNQYWSQNNRPGNMNYNYNDRNFYRNYNYWSYNHWDRRWETYRWNFYSWRDYYSAYNPYSYRFHRHYVYHPRYGHVIKRFVVRPVIFRHNNISYYCYDGHFFRHLRGVGYVLVDIPFGIAFDILPYDYERVYINGYLYFRVGNLFFERTNFGFSLIHYPERYYALSDDYINGGYYFDDDIYW